MNHFIAIQISEPEILQGVRTVQGKMMATKGTREKMEWSGELFRDTLISPATLHVTLHVMQLKDDNEKSKVIEATQRVWSVCKDEIAKKPIIVKLRGIGHFDNNFLYVKLEGEEEIRRVTNLAEKLKIEMDAMNIPGVTGEIFTPHMSVAKISKSKTLGQKGFNSFPRQFWSESEFMDFGSQQVRGIQLLSMGARDLTGYYLSLANFTLPSDV